MLAFVIAPGVQAGGQWQLAIKKAAVTKGKRVVLQEIARPMQGLEQGEWQGLADKPLWKSPQTGREARIYRAELKRLLARYLPERVDYCLLPNQLVLQSGGELLQKEELSKQVISFIRKKTKSWSGEKKLRNLNLPEHIFVPGTFGEIKVEMSSSIKPGYNSFWLKVINDQLEGKRKLSGNVFIDVWRSVPCAARPIKRKELLTPEMITYERKNLAYLSYTVWSGKGGPWRTTRSLGRDQVIYKRNLEPMPLICKGSQVNLVYESKLIHLLVPAKALTDANAGEEIRVMNLQSRQMVVGKVKNGSTVIIR